MQIRRVTPDERAQMKQKQEHLFMATMEMLHDSDPVGIGHIEDEYDLEAADIAVNLHQCATLEEIRTLSYEVFLLWFSKELAADVLDIPLERFADMLDLVRAGRE